MPWKPLPNVAFATAVFPFRGTEVQDLPLEVGDDLYIIEQGGTRGEWYRGYLVAPPSLLAGLNSTKGQALEARVFSGIFPRNCVEVRELLGDNKVGNKHRSERLGEQAAVGADDIGGGQLAREARRKSAKARRLSRAPSRGISKKDSTNSRDLLEGDEPVPRMPGAPKPIAPVPLLRVGDETGMSAEEPLVDEISSGLREWHSTRLHELLLARRYSQLGRVSELVKRLDTSRKQLLHDVLTMKELNKLREDTVWDLVAGNKMLSGEVIVRAPYEKGRVLTADDSVIEMTKLQANMSLLDRPPKPPADKHNLYHVMVDVKTLVCEQEAPATLHMYLCLKVPGDIPRPLSEPYAIDVPLQESQSILGRIDLPRTLFVNLSATDVGIGAETASLYLVFQLLRDEPTLEIVTDIAATAPHAPHNSSGQANGGTTQKSGTIKGRNSFLGSRRRRLWREHASSESRRPGTSLSMRSTTQEGRNSTSTGTSADLPPRTADPSAGSTAKRTVGIGAVEIGNLLRQQSEIDQKIALWTPASAVVDREDDGPDWKDIVKELTRSPTGGFSRVHWVKRFDVLVKGFSALDLDGLIRNTPSLLHDIITTEKLGFSGAPTQARHDIYITLTEPLIPRGAMLAHAKHGPVPLSQRAVTSLANMQLTLEVRRADGSRIDGCIHTSSNRPGHTAWRSSAIQRGEGWNETIKLAILPDDVPGSHIIMSIADSPAFPFALAWIPLWDEGAFIRDGDHNIALYVYDEFSSGVTGGKRTYMGLPAFTNKHDAAHANDAVVLLRTYLCSTSYSQDPNLLGLLNWRHHHGAALISLLDRFAFVPEIEVIKQLSDVFEALFEILDEYVGSEDYEDRIFYNFVVVLGIAKDRRFDLGSVIEQYANTIYDWPHASQCLLRAWQRMINNPMDADVSRKLRATLKVGDQMLKLSVLTRQYSPQQDETEEQQPEKHPEFAEDLQKIFTGLMALMRNPMLLLLGTQTLVVQHFHSWLPELASFMSVGGILEIATNLLDACAHAQGKMILYRLILIVNYSQLDIFKPAEIRTTLIANTFRWLAPYWGETPVVTEQWRDQVRLCCSVVATQIIELGEDSCQYVPKLVQSYSAIRQQPKRQSKRNFEMLFPVTYPFPSKPTSSDVEVDEASLEISALLAAALTTKNKLYFDQSQVDIPGVLLQALQAGQSILSGEAFPSTWLSLHVSHHRFAMTALERIMDVLIHSLPETYTPDSDEAMGFNTDLWRSFYKTLFAAVSSPALAMETFPEQKRRAIWKIAGDVRELGASLLRSSWEAIGWETDEDSKMLYKIDKMGGYQVQFVPELVSPVVGLCLSVHAGLRTAGIEVLRSMIISEWEISEDLKEIQIAMINCLDTMCSTRDNVSESELQKAFMADLLDQFKPLKNSVQDALYQAVVEMFDKVGELLTLLVAVHQGGAPNETTRIMDTLRLMNFLKDLQSEEAYIRYVHQLADLQAAAGNHNEAGLALQLHADRYEWDSAANLEEMTEPKLPAQNAFERKEVLYFQIVKHFEHGLAWQNALNAYSELTQQYESNTFDFRKLARAQRAVASIYEKIAKGDRVAPRYFRVFYKGLGFPQSLRDKQFIFEGLPNDRLATFIDKMQQMHPSATILGSNGTAENYEGQYLQVFPVSPHKDLEHDVYQRTKVALPIRDYCLMSNPNKFATTSRQPASKDVAIIEQLVDKSIFTTSETFPTILRRSEIVNVEQITLTPIQAAIERTTRKTQELWALDKRVSEGEDAALSQLSKALLEQVGPESDSTVARYRGLLPESEVLDNVSDLSDLVPVEKEETPLKPLQNALKCALLDHVLAIKRCIALYTRPAQMATKAELVPRFEAMFEPELAILFPPQVDLLAGTPRTSWLTRDSAPPAANASEQATAGARVNDVTEERPPSPEKRSRGRRGSLNPFKRSSVISQKQANGGDRERSRTREPSMTRRLSAFLRDDNRDEHERPGSTLVEQNGVMSSGGILRKRLSWIGNGN